MLAILWSCDGEPPPSTVDLRSLPRPRLSELDPAARSQLTTARRRLELAPEDAGEAVPEQLGALCRLYCAYQLDPAAAGVCAEAGRRSDKPRWPYLEGIARIGIGDPEGAEEALLRAEQRGMTGTAIQIRLGELALDSGRPDEAGTRFRRAVELDEAAAAAWWGIGRAARARGEMDLAYGALSRSLELAPEALAIHHPLAMIQRDRGDVDAARWHLERAGKGIPRLIDPEIGALGALVISAEALVAQGDRLRLAGRHEAALRMYQEAVELDPRHARAHHNLGAMLGAAGQHDVALSHLRLAVEIDGDRLDARVDLATALAATGRFDEALAQLQLVIDRDPGDVVAWMRSIEILRHVGRRAQADAALSELRTLRPDDPRLQRGDDADAPEAPALQ